MFTKLCVFLCLHSILIFHLYLSFYNKMYFISHFLYITKNIHKSQGFYKNKQNCMQYLHISKYHFKVMQGCVYVSLRAFICCA
nr:MAG TPA: hypothetical protein [Caudoviricetes sp.]